MGHATGGTWMNSQGTLNEERKQEITAKLPKLYYTEGTEGHIGVKRAVGKFQYFQFFFATF
jgi:hypothetical protein